RARIARGFCDARTHRLACEEVNPSPGPADRTGDFAGFTRVAVCFATRFKVFLRRLGDPSDVGRAVTPARLPQEAALDDAVFERMKRNDRQPPARRQSRHSIGDEGFYRAQLLIDGDAQGLKSARRRVNPPAARWVKDAH